MAPAEIVVIGAGPGGAVCAIELARRGHRVALVESAPGPRYRVGESLSPTAVAVLESVGVDLASAGFVAKRGATFVWGQRGVFRVRYADASAWQVRREELDTALLAAAARAGVRVLAGHQARHVNFTGRRAVGVRLRDGAGRVSELPAAWVVDATGRDALVARQLREQDTGTGPVPPCVLWSTWTGAAGLAGDAAGDGLYVGSGGCAWWYVPVDDRTGQVSVGTAMPYPGAERLGPDRYRRLYRDALAGAPWIGRLLERAAPVGPVRVATGGSQLSRRLAGAGWLLVGDAAGYVDPILTPGVQLAVQFGQLAAGTLDDVLTGRAGAADALRDYERRLRHQLDTYRWLCGHLYAAAAPAVAVPPGTPAGDERTDRMTFLSTISGLPAPRLAAKLGGYMAMRAGARRYGGPAAVLSETEGFAFLMWLAGGPVPPAAPAGTSAGVPPAALRVAPGLRYEDVPGTGAGAAPVPAVRVADGPRFLLTPELSAVLDLIGTPGPGGRLAEEFAACCGGTPDPVEFQGWLDLLTRYGLVVRTAEPAAPGVSRGPESVRV